MPSIATQALETAIEELTEQMEYELLGAWRAGYDYVHVYDRPVNSLDPETEVFTLRQYLLPSNVEEPPSPSELTYRYTYDLRDIDRDDIEPYL